jgi:hypothetical protein
MKGEGWKMEDRPAQANEFTHCQIVPAAETDPLLQIRFKSQKLCPGSAAAAE